MAAGTSTPLQSKVLHKEPTNDTLVLLVNDGTRDFITPLGAIVKANGGTAVITRTERNQITNTQLSAGSITVDNDYGAVVVTGLKVDEGGSSSDMALAASAGQVRKADGSVVDGAAVTNITIGTAPSAGNKRKDVVSFKLSDQTYVVTAGTAVANADTAARPTVPDGNVALAEVAVASSVTAITNANITDIRPRPS